MLPLPCAWIVEGIWVLGLRLAHGGPQELVAGLTCALCAGVECWWDRQTGKMAGQGGRRTCDHRLIARRPETGALLSS